ncbi:hypothetical protein LX36DRAFT_654358 [Colletotrichum falcatum]|nr:hypothetical protein LX36DRAFT_654358 [Colletotrichum falcatum]
MCFAPNPKRAMNPAENEIWETQRRSPPRLATTMQCCSGFVCLATLWWCLSRLNRPETGRKGTELKELEWTEPIRRNSPDLPFIVPEYLQ